MSAFDQFPRDPSWVRCMADAEDAYEVEIGDAGREESGLSTDVRRRCLAQFIELSRRQLRLTLPQMAQRAGISLIDLLNLETAQGAAVSREALARLAQFLGINPQPLMALEGLTCSMDPQLQESLIEFAARLGSTEPLDSGEEQALQWFNSHALAHTSDQASD